MNRGNGYLSVTLTGGGGSGAKAGVRNEHLISGTITKITIADPGVGYTTAPSVNITGGGGTGATATAQIGADGSVTFPVSPALLGSGRVHPMWWTGGSHHLYTLRFHLPGAPFKPIAFKMIKRRP